jgi:hypothetical protein
LLIFAPSAGGTNFPSESFTRGFWGSGGGSSAASGGLLDSGAGLSLSGFRQNPGSLMSCHCWEDIVNLVYDKEPVFGYQLKFLIVYGNSLLSILTININRGNGKRCAGNHIRLIFHQVFYHKIHELNLLAASKPFLSFDPEYPGHPILTFVPV